MEILDWPYSGLPFFEGLLTLPPADEYIGVIQHSQQRDPPPWKPIKGGETLYHNGKNALCRGDLVSTTDGRIATCKLQICVTIGDDASER